MAIIEHQNENEFLERINVRLSADVWGLLERSANWSIYDWAENARRSLRKYVKMSPPPNLTSLPKKKKREKTVLKTLYVEKWVLEGLKKQDENRTRIINKVLKWRLSKEEKKHGKKKPRAPFMTDLIPGVDYKIKAAKDD
jgi:hypothetical protein